ncbi:MAG: ABC transporter substrate-binding protein [Nitrospiraceae bacterium]|nr:ABC transporter substrate-binding protein [Nitrospiraceae bacterium]
MRKHSDGLSRAVGVSLVLFLLLTSWLGPTLAEAEDKPADAVQGTLHECLYVLTELSDPSREAQRTWEFEQAIRRHFDYEEMAKRSLSDAWDGLRGAERRQFVKLFLQTLRDDLAEHLKGARSGSVTQVIERADQHEADVAVTLTGEEGEIATKFYLVQSSAGWMVQDLTISGGSLLEQYQGQFTRILKETTLADLMERMRQRTLLVHRLEPVGS